MASSPVAPGTVLAEKYRIDSVLGEGGMGVVVAATDTRLDRQVAIKFLLPEYAQHAEAAQRFMREARAAVKIQSEYTARVLDVGSLDTGSPYMVMQYLKGCDLAQKIKADGPLPVEDAALYIIQASEAIAEAHSYGIVHRDLKPANLFLAKQPDGSLKIKVLDFGISKVADREGVDASLTRTSSMMGSPLYMSPEQMRSTRSVDSRTDIWSLGVIFYELVTGRLPFIADSVPELSAKVLLEEPVPLSQECPHLPLELELIVHRALSKTVAERYPSIAEFVVELLPYAPVRARQNVERISKLLRAAGLSSTDFHASRPPPANADASGAYSAPNSLGSRTGERTGDRTGDRATHVSVGSGSFPSGTEVNFGSTKGPSQGVRRGIFAGLTLLVVGGTVALAVVFRGGEKNDSDRESASQPIANVAPPEPKPEPKVEALAAPKPEAGAEVAPTEPAPSASDAAEAESEAPTEKAVAKKKRVAPLKRWATKKKLQPEPKKQPPSTTPNFDFGGRE
jgi:serine/threonine-protein kinase